MPAAGHRVRRQPGDRRAVEDGCGPDVGTSCPVMTLKSVVLPAPLGPMMARRSRGGDAERHAAERAQRAPKCAAQPLDGQERRASCAQPTRAAQRAAMPPGAKSTNRMKRHAQDQHPALGVGADQALQQDEGGRARTGAAERARCRR